MAKQEVRTGQVDYTVLIFIPDPASTDGSGKTGLVAANLTVSGVRVETDNDVTVIDYTASLNNLAALTTAHTDWGLLEVSSTLAPGLYRLDIADAIFATGAWSAVVYAMVTTSAAAASPMEFVLVPQAPIDGVLLAPTTHTSAVIPTVTTVGTLTTYTGNTPQTGDVFPLASTEIADIKAKTDNLPADPADESLIIAATDAIVAAIAALNNLSQANVRSALGLASANLDTQLLPVANLPSGIKKNTALANFEFLMVLASDHYTAATGLTITATRSIDGGAFAACANAASEVSVGVYKISLAAADLNGDVITLRFASATADDRFITVITEP